MTDDERLPEPSEDPEGTVEALLAEVLGLIEQAVAAEFPGAELDRAAAIGCLARAEAATMRREAERYLDAALDRAAEIVATAREQAEHVLTAAREAATVLATGPQIDDLFAAAAWVFERPVDHRGADPEQAGGPVHAAGAVGPGPGRAQPRRRRGARAVGVVAADAAAAPVSRAPHQRVDGDQYLQGRAAAVPAPARATNGRHRRTGGRWP
jgi:hypothetical protein